MKSTIQPILRAPGAKYPAAPGIPEHIRALARLMDMDFLWVKQKGYYIASVRDNKPGSKFAEHMFEANPKMLSTDEAWLEFMKQVADFMADKGKDTKAFQASLRVSLDRLNATSENEHGSTEEQTPATGGPDSGSGPEHAGSDATPGPISPDFDRRTGAP